MNTKFCASCWKHTNQIDGGVIRKSGKVTRWVCARCVQLKSTPNYLSKVNASRA